MSLRLQIGRLLGAVETGLLSRQWFPLFNRFLGGRNWMFDACRFAGTREFRMLFDVGANSGNLSREMAQFFPLAVIHAFEPIRATYSGLVDNTHRHSRIVPHQLALSDSAGESTVAIQSCSELNSLRFQAPTDPQLESEQVQISTVELFCAEHKIAEIDILKIDAQGYDLAVLRGAGGLLRSHRVPYLLVEASFTRGDETNQAFAPLHSFLTDLGYVACGVYDQNNYGPRLRYLGCFNLLYLHPTALALRFPSSESL